MNLKQGSIGTIIVGVIFILTGLTYLNNIVDNAIPFDWQKAQERELYNFEETAIKATLQQEDSFKAENFSFQANDRQRQVLQQHIESAREKIPKVMEAWQMLQVEYFFWGYPTVLIAFSVVTMWLLLVGVGFLIIFPWSRGFVFLSIFVNYFWQTYVFLYEKKVAEIFFNFHNAVNRSLNLPVPTMGPWLEDIPTMVQILQSAIFIGMLAYFSSAAGRELFREQRKYDFTDIIPEIKIKPK